MPIVFAGSAREDFEINENTSTWVRGVSPNPERLSPDMNEGIYLPSSGAIAKASWKQALKNWWMTIYVNLEDTVIGSRNGELWIGKKTAWPLNFPETVRIVFFHRLNNAQNGGTVYINGVERGEFIVPLPGRWENVRYDIRYVNDPVNGMIQVYGNGVLVFQWNGNTENGVTSHDAMILWNRASTAEAVYSGIMVGTSDSRIFRMKPMTVVGNGTFQEWQGSYTDINEAGLDLTTFIESNTPGATTTYAWDKPTTPDGYQIAGIAMNATASVYGPVATDIIPVYYDGNNVIDMGAYNVDSLVLRGQLLVAEVDPATGTRFTSEQLALLEFGFKIPEAA